MSVPAKRRATYEDLLALPENVIGEILAGELIASPRPAGKHGRVMTVLPSRLMPPFDDGNGGPGGWWFIVEPELHFSEDVVVPDVAGWRRDRMPPDPGAPFFTVAPGWVCEIASPSTFRIDRMRKLPRYAEVGVEYAWLIDPIEKTLEVYRNDGQKHFALIQTAEGDAKVRAEPFDAIELELKMLWL
jgi:Uma2 family endonuclease